jgi:hypothetical protein
MPDKNIHPTPPSVDPIVLKTSAEAVKLEEQSKSESAANDDNLFTLCCPAKSRTELSTRYWDGIKQYRSRMRKIPVKRVFSPIA